MALNLEHRARVPEAAAEGQPWPAVVMVHGWLGNENVMSIFERTVPAGVVLVYPRAPITVKPDSYGWFTLDDPATFAPGLNALEAFIRALPDAYPVDPARVVLMGFSQGAAMCLSLLLKQPELATGVAGLAGFLPQQAQAWAAPGRLAGKRVLLSHGTEDETVPVAWAKAAVERLRFAGAEVRYEEYPVGHKLNAQGMKDLKAWMASAVESHAGP
jgi:phospholipase/carboxylesterase